jgi:CDP-glucose 4,6-dehydratase
MFHLFNNKKVLITGHTGFKGSWLSYWLKLMGANVFGVGLKPHTNPSLFYTLGLEKDIHNSYIDIRDTENVIEIINTVQPDYLFHLAAQSLVINSYQDPVKTWSTNLIGTINVLEGLRTIKKKCSAVIVTSDKCYENLEWIWGYRENDRLGGFDPYSASKGAAEIAIRSYIKSYFNDDSPVRIASARAGNVIGGGDWSDYRIIPDCIRSWSKGESVILRNPLSTRPWQHVLEPLSGYLLLGSELLQKSEFHSEPFNFGPSNNENFSVLELVKEMSIHWDKVGWLINKENNNKYESLLLKLNCDKALNFLKWETVMNFKDTVELTIEWYKYYYTNSNEVIDLTKNQIYSYMSKAKDKNIPWAI